MRTRHIEVFHAIYTCGSVTKASEMLNVSQPSVSKVLSHAETQLGYLLFNRSAGRMIPTHEGQKLFAHVERLFEELNVVRRVADNLKKIGEDDVRLAATPALGTTLVPDMVTSFLKHFPNTYFELETLHFAEIVAAIRESRVDLALAFDPVEQPGVTITPLLTGEFVLIKPIQIKLKIDKPIALPDLKGLPFVKLNTRGPLGRLLDNYLDLSANALNIVAATETYQIAYSLVERGMGVAIVDEFTARSYRSDNIEILRLKLPLSFNVCAVHSADGLQSSTSQAFLTHCQQAASEIIKT